jgi:hypothetical protein
VCRSVRSSLQVGLSDENSPQVNGKCRHRDQDDETQCGEDGDGASAVTFACSAIHSDALSCQRNAQKTGLPNPII